MLFCPTVQLVPIEGPQISVTANVVAKWPNLPLPLMAAGWKTYAKSISNRNGYQF